VGIQEGCLRVDGRLIEELPTNWRESLVFREGYEPKIEFPFKTWDRVLIRDQEDELWIAAEFSHIDSDGNLYLVGGEYYDYNIAYKGNEDLVGTTKESNTKVWTKKDFE